jgi:RNA exonuclease 1
VFYNSLSNYLLSEDELVANGYPRPTDSAGMASINIEGRRTSIIEPVNENAVRHYCSRCQKPFLIYNSGGYQSVDECLYHYGRLYKSKEYGEGIVSKYSCCGERRSAPGCQAAQMHVTEGEQQPLLRGCVRSVPPPSEGYHPSVYSLDCEMCYTTKGLELTRVSLVDWNLATIYESLVRPEFPVIDYNTRFSGLTAENFDGVIKSLPDVQLELLSIIYDDTILIGHSLESDLKALKVIIIC